MLVIEYILQMDSNITFSRYSIDEKYKNLYTSNEILDNNIEDVNKIIFRIPKDIKKIDNIILSYDGQNLFDSSTSHFGTIFNLENIIQTYERQINKNFLIIGITSNSNRQTQYNPYPEFSDINYAEIHIKNVVSKFLPSVTNFLNVNLDQANLIVAGASMGGLMSIKTSILYPEFENIISLSPAFWFGYPQVLKDIKNLNDKSTVHLYTGKREGHIFGKHVKDIFPKEWDLDFSNNDNFYFSGVQKLKDALMTNKKNVFFSDSASGKHDENSWSLALIKIFENL